MFLSAMVLPSSKQSKSCDREVSTALRVKTAKFFFSEDDLLAATLKAFIHAGVKSQPLKDRRGVSDVANPSGGAEVR